jgi:aldehyde dehydrogenase (NAD+)/phenylacetaldehyde dehydrogenase
MHTKLFINGKWEDAASGKTFPTINPPPQKSSRRLPKAMLKISTAPSRARALDGPWGKMNASERAASFGKWVSACSHARMRLPSFETLDNGKTITESSRIDVPYSADLYFYYGGAATKLEGHTIPVNGPYFNYTLREPLGVVGLIVPWNFPLLLASRKVAQRCSGQCGHFETRGANAINRFGSR